MFLPWNMEGYTTYSKVDHCGKIGFTSSAFCKVLCRLKCATEEMATSSQWMNAYQKPLARALQLLVVTGWGWHWETSYLHKQVTGNILLLLAQKLQNCLQYLLVGYGLVNCVNVFKASVVQHNIDHDIYDHKMWLTQPGGPGQAGQLGSTRTNARHSIIDTGADSW